MIDLLKVSNTSALCPYPNAIVRVQEMVNLCIFYAKNLFVSLKNKTKHGKVNWSQHNKLFEDEFMCWNKAGVLIQIG